MKVLMEQLKAGPALVVSKARRKKKKCMWEEKEGLNDNDLVFLTDEELLLEEEDDEGGGGGGVENAAAAGVTTGCGGGANANANANDNNDEKKDLVEVVERRRFVSVHYSKKFGLFWAEFGISRVASLSLQIAEHLAMEMAVQKDLARRYFSLVNAVFMRAWDVARHHYGMTEAERNGGSVIMGGWAT